MMTDRDILEYTGLTLTEISRMNQRQRRMFEGMREIEIELGTWPPQAPPKPPRDPMLMAFYPESVLGV